MHRLVHSTFIVAGLALATRAAAPQPTLTGTATLRPESRVWFDGTSTVRGFSCNAADLSAGVVTDAQAPIASFVRSAQVTIPVARLDCKNGTMNGHMRRALNAEEHPNIIWRMTSYRVDGDTVVVSGSLTIAGRTNAVELTGRGNVAAGVVRFRGNSEIRMTEYGVRPPTLMLGTMRVHETVTVKFDIALDI